MTLAEKLRTACVAYWRHRNTPGGYRWRLASERLYRVAEAYRAGWTLEMVEEVDGEAKGEVVR